MEHSVALELKNITKTFGSVVANKNISLKVKRGEILSVLGENGSGKTTLMNMVSGIYYPDSGHIFVDGKEIKMTVKVGDKVITSKYSGTEVKADGVEYTIVRQGDILAIVED